MPELPEVEVTRRRIVPALVGRTVAAVETTAPSYVFLTPPRRLARRLTGRTVVGVDRLGKYLVARLDDGTRLLVHLGMTGALSPASEMRPAARSRSGRAGAPGAPDPHTHLRLRFRDGGPAVCFRDPRKFGKLALLEPGAASPRLERLGPDALTATGARLLEASRGRSVPIKSLLLDQSVLTGVGNIYADEALFEAGISPKRPAGGLTPADCRRLAAAVRAVLRRAIRRGAAYGERGDAFRVYGRADRPCVRCGRPLRRTVIGGRSSHSCPRCQAR